MPASSCLLRRLQDWTGMPPHHNWCAGPRPRPRSAARPRPPRSPPATPQYPPGPLGPTSHWRGGAGSAAKQVRPRARVGAGTRAGVWMLAEAGWAAGYSRGRSRCSENNAQFSISLSLKVFPCKAVAVIKLEIHSEPAEVQPSGCVRQVEKTPLLRPARAAVDSAGMECGQDWVELRAAAHHKLELVQRLVQQQQGGRVRRDYGGHDDHHDHFDGEVVIKCRNSYTGGNTVTN